MWEVSRLALRALQNSAANATMFRATVEHGRVDTRVLSTGLASVAGLAAAVAIGSLLAILFSQSRKLRLALFPYVILLQTVPIVAVAPLLIIWSGYTFRTVVIVTVIVLSVPIVNGVTTGLLSIDRDASDLFVPLSSGPFKLTTIVANAFCCGASSLGCQD